MTKLEMAQTIVRVLYAMRDNPSADDRRVRKMARNSVACLQERYKLALKVLDQAAQARQLALHGAFSSEVH